MTFGRWLCHYTTAEAAFEHILPSRKLRLSPYRTMRDPLENKDIRLNLTFSGWGGTATDELFGRVGNAFHVIRDGMRIVSFTADADDSPAPFGCGWGRPRMWEQYGGVHRGACLVFDRTTVIETLRTQVHERDLGITYAGEVEYTKEGFAGAHSRHLPADYFAEGKVSERVSTYVEDHHRELFFMKTDDWRTEFEYRIALFGPGDDEVDLSFADSLKAVVVGEQFPPWGLPGAREECEKVGAELYRLNWEMAKPFLRSSGKPVDPGH